MEITIANARMFWLSAGVSPASSTKYTASKPPNDHDNDGIEDAEDNDADLITA